MAAGGTLIAYMGDGIMAAFGAPLEQEDHADRALRAAREMIGPRLERFNAWLAEQGHESGFAMGVGLNSGPVMAGNVGSEQRVEYTTIGDTTNTASRLEHQCRGGEAIVSQAVLTDPEAREVLRARQFSEDSATLRGSTTETDTGTADGCAAATAFCSGLAPGNSK